MIFEEFSKCYPKPKNRRRDLISIGRPILTKSMPSNFGYYCGLFPAFRFTLVQGEYALRFDYATSAPYRWQKDNESAVGLKYTMTKQNCFAWEWLGKFKL